MQDSVPERTVRKLIIMAGMIKHRKKNLVIEHKPSSLSKHVPLEILGVAALGISSMRLVIASGSILQKSRENKGAVESITK